MLVVTIRTDKPEAEIGMYSDGTQVAYETWQAHRQLAETLHSKLAALLERQGKNWQDVGGIIGYKGPGSFTGLRIGLSVVNALGYGLDVPVVACDGQEWIQDGIDALISGTKDEIAIPNYGSAAHVTAPRK